MENKIMFNVVWFEESTYQQARRVKKEQGLKSFNSLSFQYGRVPEGEYELETNCIFENQYNALHIETQKSYRVFEYASPLHERTLQPLHWGYYIENIQSIRALQNSISKCGYCGKQYIDSKQKFCEACLGSEYLKEKDLSLLKITPILEKKQYDKIKISKAFLKKYQVAQRKSRKKRLLKDQKHKLESIKKKIADSKKELLAFKWLIKNNIDYSNCIYYSHTDIFCFGWRDSLTDQERVSYKKRLADFPFNYEFK